LVTVHIDENHKPSPWEDNVKQETDVMMVESGHKLLSRLQKQSQLLMQMRNKNDKIFFEKIVGPETIDLDFNNHVNQGVYCRWIDSCIFDFDKDYYRGVYYISDLIMRFVGETKRFNNNNENKVTVQLIKLNQNNNDRSKEYVGIIKQNNQITTAFSCLLTLAQNKMKKPSKL